uniref:Ribonuclease H-like domain, reverse transcriptase, RNA-dependent DNA polymerase n=1 Tax=Tanacetum cinerariifolium TaxID=118510 RepID=A0A699GFF8_TANCI|nr:ribonuclease H-like domain, reverse transcriptase, RNA-dependent DNA polymerase [Tanacetum cinerariifolium]
METQKPLLKDEDGKEVDVYMYRSKIGSLIYITSSRPDIMFAVCACARYQVNLKVSHLHVVKRIFSYLKGQLKLGLWYPKDSPFDLVAYIDSDYDRSSLDRKSTTGGDMEVYDSRIGEVVVVLGGLNRGYLRDQGRGCASFLAMKMEDIYYSRCLNGLERLWCLSLSRYVRVNTLHFIRNAPDEYYVTGYHNDGSECNGYDLDHVGFRQRRCLLTVGNLEESLIISTYFFPNHVTNQVRVMVSDLLTSTVTMRRVCVAQNRQGHVLSGQGWHILVYVERIQVGSRLVFTNLLNNYFSMILFADSGLGLRFERIPRMPLNGLAPFVFSPTDKGKNNGYWRARYEGCKLLIRFRPPSCMWRIMSLSFKVESISPRISAATSEAIGRLYCRPSRILDIVGPNKRQRLNKYLNLVNNAYENTLAILEDESSGKIPKEVTMNQKLEKTSIMNDISNYEVDMVYDECRKTNNKLNKEETNTDSDDEQPAIFKRSKKVPHTSLQGKHKFTYIEDSDEEEGNILNSIYSKTCYNDKNNDEDGYASEYNQHEFTVQDEDIDKEEGNIQNYIYPYTWSNINDNDKDGVDL